MAFRDLFESCFRDLPVVLITKEKVTEIKESVTTLDNVFSSSQYVVFFFGNGSRSIELGRTLEELVKKRNEPVNGKAKDSSPARLRRFFGLKKKKSSRDRSSPEGNTVVSVIQVGGEIEEEMIEGWFSLIPSEDARIRSRLLRSLSVETNPSIVVVDSVSKGVITTDGRRLLAEDPKGNDFPWPTPDVTTVLLNEDCLVRWEGNGVKKASGERAKVRALLFGAVWCPPCREWLKQLVPIYSSLRSSSLSFEIIFCSSDRTEEAFNSFIAQMPWVSLPYDPSKSIALTRIFNVHGIPSLILIDESNRIISRHGRSVLLEDPKGVYFPWGARPLQELNEHSVSRLREEPSLILFTEGSPDDVRFSLSILDEVGPSLHAEIVEREERRAGRRESEQRRPSADENNSTDSSLDAVVPSYADPLQVFFTGEDPICDHILDHILCMGDAELPLLVIVDSVSGVFAVCEEEDVSREVIDAFVSSYKGGKLKWRALPSSESTRTVGGIPTAAIREATRQSALIKMSPSQGSIGDENKQLTA
uniref:Thioredoxin-like_fold domain-containing protein n=1 Tax=Pristionchus pacificus TaxID=54126 RepID=A0A8R1YFV1_PRIPA